MQTKDHPRSFEWRPSLNARHWSPLLVASLFAWAQLGQAILAGPFPLPYPTRPTSFPLSRSTQVGTVVAWGENQSGQANPQAGLVGVVAVSAGEHHTLALLSDGTVRAWGRNTFTQATVPDGLRDVVAIAAGETHNLVLIKDGTLRVWGNNDTGQGVVPDGLKDVVAIATGGNHNVALRIMSSLL